MKKALSIAFLVTMALMFNLTNTPMRAFGAEREIVLGQFDWTGPIIQCNILKQVIETKFNIPVKIIQLNQSVAWQAMHKGEVDVSPEVWSPNWDATIAKYVEQEKTVAVALTLNRCRQGWVIPTLIAKKHNIKTVNDLRKYSEVFDITGDKKGDLWCGGAGWGITEPNQLKIRDYKLGFEGWVATPWVAMAALRAALEKKKGILLNAYTPDWIHAVYDLTWIEEPEYDPAKYKYVPGKPNESYVACAHPWAKVYTAVSLKTKERHPKVFNMIKNFSLPVDELSFLIAEVEDVPGKTKQPVADAVKKWISNNPDIVNKFFEGID